MLQAKIRLAAVTALALLLPFFMSASRPGSTSWQANAQEPAKQKITASKLKELLEERAATTRKLADQAALRTKVGIGTVDELLAPNRLALEAALELCESDKDRVKVLEDFLPAAREIERLALQGFKAGQARQTDLLQAKAERLRIEIALERAKAGKTASKPGNAKEAQPQKKKDGQKVCVQAGTVEPFESVQIFARVTGILKTQRVDIGDRVKRGDVLAVLDVPELEAQLQVDTAAVDQARARVQQAKARVNGVRAALDTTKAGVVQAEASVKSAAAGVKYRALTYQRLKNLFELKSIEESILDESKERFDSAVETANAAKAAVAGAKAQVAAAMTKIDQAEADLTESEAGVKLAQAQRERSQKQLAFATLAAPFDGVITKRSFAPGALIRTTGNQPIVTLQRTDLVRIVVSVPERDAPHIRAGNAADVEIDAFPGKKWSAKVSRTSVVIDAKTRTMRVEVDVANSDGQIRAGMTASVAIILAK